MAYMQTILATLETKVPKKGVTSEQFLKMFFFLAPSIIFSQAFIGGWIASLIMGLRMIAAPLLVLLLLPKLIHWPSLFGLLVLILSSSYTGLDQQPQSFVIVFTALMGGIIFFRFGLGLGGKTDFMYVWPFLTYGVSLLNLVVLIVLSFIEVGLIDYSYVFLPIQRDLDYGLSRFSIGSPIEVPFIMSALLYAGIRKSPPNRTFMAAVMLNLITAMISQSRVVILIAIVMAIDQWLRCKNSIRLLSLFILLLGIYIARDYFDPIFSSISLRYGGDDYGSRDDRIELFSSVLTNFGPLQVFFGKGLTSGAQLIQNLRGEYRSVESVVLQLLYEVGFGGIILVVASAFAGHRNNINFKVMLSPIYLLLWVQLLFFLPITDLLPITAFALGVISSSPQLTISPSFPTSAK